MATNIDYPKVVRNVFGESRVQWNNLITTQVSAEDAAKCEEYGGLDQVYADIASGKVGTQIARDMGVDDWAFVMIVNREPERLAQAKMMLADTLFSEMIALSDECRKGRRVTTKANGDTETVEFDAVDRVKLQIDTRKWVVSKLNPKKYGDKLEVSGNADAPLQVQHTINSLRGLSDEELRVMQQMLSKASKTVNTVENEP